MVFLMTPVSNWLPMMKAFNKYTLILFILLIAQPLRAQHWVLMDSVTFDHQGLLLTKDRGDNLYIAFESGTITKFDSTGKTLSSYAPDQYAQPLIMESWASLRLFVFFGNTQEYTFLDRFLSGALLTRLPPTLGFVSLATATSTNQLWLIDEREFRLLKYDFEFDQIVLERSFNQLPEALDLKPWYIKEYQNRLYVGDKSKGVLVFDNLGNYLTTLDIPYGTFDFEDEQLYYLDHDQLVLLNLYNQQTQRINLPEGDHTAVQLLAHRVVLLEGRSLKIFAYKP